MPRGTGWDGLAFVIALCLFGINLALSYAITVIKIVRNEEAFADNIALLGIWAVLAFAQIKLADNLATYFHYKTADIKNVSFSKTNFEKGDFFLISDAQILQELTSETTFSFPITAKGQSTRYKKIAYKIVPIVAQNWDNQPIFAFSVQNAEENPKAIPDIKAVWHRPRSSEYAEKYPDLADWFFKKYYTLPKTETFIFLESIDLQEKIAEEENFVAWFYGIVMIIWTLALGIALAKQKQKDI